MNVVPQALITVSNHVAALDDPLLTAALVPAGALLQPSALRWTLCATDRCFTSRAATTFFRAAKVGRIPRIVRSHNKKRPPVIVRCPITFREAGAQSAVADIFP